MSSNNQLLKEEEDHLQEVLTRNKYPLWALNRVKIKSKNSQAQHQQRTQSNVNTRGKTGNQKSYMVLPYVKGLSESIKNVGKKAWYPDILQGRQHYQKPSDDSQRQRSYNQEKWYHL